MLAGGWYPETAELAEFRRGIEDLFRARSNEVGLQITTASSFDYSVNRVMHWRTEENRLLFSWAFFDANGTRFGIINSSFDFGEFGIDPSNVGSDPTGALKERVVSRALQELAKAVQ